MGEKLGRSAGTGLERSCDGRRDWVRARRPVDGLERLEAWFGGVAYARHRHDTYAIGLTVQGVQRFTYRGASVASLAGQVLVLHPDEPHDGRAGTTEGFGYRIVYVDPVRIADAVHAIAGRARPLPFAASAVSCNPTIARALADAFRERPEPLAVDGIVFDLARGLLEEETSPGAGPVVVRHVDRPALERARQFLDAERFRVVHSSEIEAVTGLSRFELARQFRGRFGTSPYRYLLMRRLDAARALLRDRRTGLAELAFDVGFADQAHFTRAFKTAYGLTPSRYRTLFAPAPA